MIINPAVIALALLGPCLVGADLVVVDGAGGLAQVYVYNDAGTR